MNISSKMSGYSDTNIVYFLLLLTLFRCSYTQENLNCDFGDDGCAWDKGAGEEGDPWQILMKNPYNDIGPMEDSKRGKFIQFKTNPVIDAANLTSPLISVDPINDTGICFTFDYYVFGEIGDVWLETQEGEPTADRDEYRWLGTARFDDVWHNTQIFIDNVVHDYVLNFQVTVRGGRGQDGVVAFDNFVAHKGPCGGGSTECDFEGNTCDWEPELEAKVPWNLTMARDGKQPGPWVDHTTTTSDGWFVEMGPCSEDMASTLLMKANTISIFGSICLSMWVFSSVESNIRQDLIVYKELDNGTLVKIGTPITRPFWSSYHLNITSYGNETFNLTIQGQCEGRISAGIVIAVDDISLQNVPCDRVDFCNFDSGDWCFFGNFLSHISPIPWQLGHGRTLRPDLIEGQTSDHTTSSTTGLYAYVDYTYAAEQNGTQAQLYSKAIPVLGCLKLSFYMLQYGDDAGTLTAYIANWEDHEDIKSVWAISKKDVKSWTKVNIKIYDVKKISHIILEASIPGPKGFVAIDDFFYESCRDTPPEPAAWCGGGCMAGMVVGGVAVLAVLVFLVFYRRRVASICSRKRYIYT